MAADGYPMVMPDLFFGVFEDNVITVGKVFFFPLILNTTFKLEIVPPTDLGDTFNWDICQALNVSS